MRVARARSPRGCGTSSTTGFDRLPDDGPAILCPNHISFLDSAFLMLTVPRNISFVGKAEYMDSWKTKYLFPAMGMIPIDRSGGDKRSAALDAAEAVLRRGELFGIFPEGTRSRDGTLLQGAHRRGAAGARRSAARSSRSASSAPTRSSRPTPRCRSCSGRARSRSAGRSAPSATRRVAERHLALPVDDRRGDVRDPRAHRPGVPQRLRRRADTEATCRPVRTGADRSRRRALDRAGDRPAPPACSSARRADAPTAATAGGAGGGAS